MADWFDLGSTAVGGVGGIFSTLINNEHQKRMAREQMQWQQQENERAYQRDIDFWNMQNQYNSPQAQRERLEAAGANPMLAFGNGVNVTSGNSTSEVSMKPAQAIMPDLQPYNLGQPFYNLADKLFQHQLLNQQIKMQDAQIGEINAETLSKLQKLKLDKSTYDYSVDMARENLNLIRETVKSKQQEIDINQQRFELEAVAKKNDIDLQYLNLATEREVQTVRAGIVALEKTMLENKIELTKQEKQLIIKQFEKLSQDVGNNAYWETIRRTLGSENPNSNYVSAFSNQLMTNFYNFLEWIGFNPYGK